VTATSVSRWVAVLVTLAVPALAQRKAEWEIHVGEKIAAPVVRGVAEPGGDAAWLATPGALYRVEQGAPRLVSKPPAEGARLQLAPGGGVYAWVVTTGTAKRHSTRIELYRLDGDRIATIEPEPALGPDELLLGFEGKLILTFAPLDDPEGGRGRFRYTFWDLSGRRLGAVTLPKAIPILAADGSAVALLTEKDAQVFSAAGTALWTVAGAYRKGALTSGGRRAAFNPQARGSLDAIVLVDGGRQRATLKIPTAVHHLATSPDGELVVVAGDRGRHFVIERDRVREGRPVAPDKGTPYVFDLEVAGPDAIVMGVLYRRPEQHPAWVAGAILAFNRRGTLTFRHDFAIREATGTVPGVDVQWGAGAFVGYTRESAILGRLTGGR
jgi:hypothetical protein